MKGGVIIAYTAFTLFIIKGITFIGYFRRFAQYGESVGKSRGDEELLFIFRRQFDAHVPAIGRRTLPDIEGDVQYSALEYTEQFGLGIRLELVVQATNDSVAGEGLIVLDEPGGNALLPESLFIVRFKEISPVIHQDLRFKNEQPGKVCCYKRHFEFPVCCLRLLV